MLLWVIQCFGLLLSCLLSKYEWRANGMSASYRGMRSCTGVQKVVIYIKDGVVEQVMPFNL